MEIKISKKNSKLGKIPNISFPPGTSCVDNIPCLREGCYALGPYRRYPNVKTAWDHNLAMYQADPANFFSQFKAWLQDNCPPQFRLFVGGDFISQSCFDWFQLVIAACPDTTFVAFTKRYELDASYKPSNFKLYLSTWPGVELPENPFNLPMSWLEEDPRKPEEYFRCPGNCTTCGRTCWRIGNDFDIVFPKH